MVAVGDRQKNESEALPTELSPLFDMHHPGVVFVSMSIKGTSIAT